MDASFYSPFYAFTYLEKASSHKRSKKMMRIVYYEFLLTLTHEDFFNGNATDRDPSPSMLVFVFMKSSFELIFFYKLCTSRTAAYIRPFFLFGKMQWHYETCGYAMTVTSIDIPTLFNFQCLECTFGYFYFHALLFDCWIEESDVKNVKWLQNK